MSAKPFTFPIKVLPDDIDFMGHVNNARYLNWVQDTVLAHWQKLAPAEEVASKAWVALKHERDLKVGYKVANGLAQEHVDFLRSCS